LPQKSYRHFDFGFASCCEAVAMPRHERDVRIRLRLRFRFSLVNGCTLRHEGHSPNSKMTPYGVAQPPPHNRRQSQNHTFEAKPTFLVHYSARISFVWSVSQSDKGFALYEITLISTFFGSLTLLNR